MEAPCSRTTIMTTRGSMERALRRDIGDRMKRGDHLPTITILMQPMLHRGASQPETERDDRRESNQY
jgi:hypothetical protein